MIGINNTWAAEEPVADSVFEGARAVMDALHALKPGSRMVLQSILPTMDAAKNDIVVKPVNKRLAALSRMPQYAGYISNLDLYPGFVDPTGKQIDALFNDGLHPNEAGYRVWRDRLVPFLQQARSATAR